MRRRRVKRSYDRKIFRHTANRVRKANIPRQIPRGGIQL